MAKKSKTAQNIHILCNKLILKIFIIIIILLYNFFLIYLFLIYGEQFEKNYNFIDSFVIYMCIEGGMEIIYSDSEMETIKAGESVLVPAALKTLQLRPMGESKVLEIYIK